VRSQSVADARVDASSDRLSDGSQSASSLSVEPKLYPTEVDQGADWLDRVYSLTVR